MLLNKAYYPCEKKLKINTQINFESNTKMSELAFTLIYMIKNNDLTLMRDLLNIDFHSSKSKSDTLSEER